MKRREWTGLSVCLTHLQAKRQKVSSFTLSLSSRLFPKERVREMREKGTCPSLSHSHLKREKGERSVRERGRHCDILTGD